MGIVPLVTHLLSQRVQLCGLASQTNHRQEGFLRRKPKGKSIKSSVVSKFLMEQARE